MGFVRGLTRATDVVTESRSLENPNIPLSAAAVAQYFGVDATANPSGISVTPQTATNQSAVWRCVALVSQIAGYLPLDAYGVGTFTKKQNNLLANPHPEMTASEVWGLSATHRALYGNSYFQKMKNGMGATVELWPISPERITGVTRITSGRHRGLKLFQITLEDGTWDVFDSTEILHIPHWSNDGLVGISPIHSARLAIGLSQAAEEYSARLFGSGNLMSGVLQTDVRLKEEDAEALKARWEKKVSGLGKSHGTVILDSGATFQQLTMPNSDAQFLESRQFQILEIGRYFGVPPFLLFETERATSWGTGLEQQSLGWLSFDIAPRWLSPLENRLTKELTGSGVQARYDMNRLLRGDSAAMGEFFRTMREIGALNADEIRGEIGRDPLPDGQGKVYLMPSNMQSLGQGVMAPSTGADVNKDGQPDLGPGVTNEPAKGAKK